MIGRIFKGETEAVYGDDRRWSSSNESLSRWLDAMFGSETGHGGQPPSTPVVDAANRLGFTYVIVPKKPLASAQGPGVTN